MAEISVGEAVGEGFSLIRRQPLAVMAWGLLQIGLMALAFTLMAPVYASVFGQAMRQGQGAAIAPADLQRMMQAQSVIYLFDIASLAVGAVTACAVFRAVLHPDQSRFAYLRLGPAELYLGLLILVGAFALGIGVFVAMIPIMIVVFSLVALHAGAVAAIFGVVAGIAAIVVLFYLVLRISLVGPMMVDEGRFRLTEAWALTRGKVAGLLAIALLLLLIIMAVELVLGVLLVALGFGAVAVLAGGLQNLPVLLRQPPQAILGRLAPLLVVMGLIWIPLAGCFSAIMSAPWARAYRDLRPRRDIAETFA